MKRSMTSAEFEQEVGMLADLSRPDLVEHWRALYGADPPKGISRPLLVRAVAYQMQAKRYGGLKSATARRLRVIASGQTEAGHGNTDNVVLKPGARLVREWNGMTHVVEVVDGGFIWDGERHRSLSAIARAITGARWSGPRFFGLNTGPTS